MRSFVFLMILVALVSAVLVLNEEFAKAALDALILATLCAGVLICYVSPFVAGMLIGVIFIFDKTFMGVIVRFFSYILMSVVVAYADVQLFFIAENYFGLALEEVNGIVLMASITSVAGMLFGWWSSKFAEKRA